MKKALVIASLIFVVLGLSACAKRHKVLDIQQHHLPSHASKLSTSEMGAHIKNIAAKRGWVCQDEPKIRKMVCSLNRRQHQAFIEIKYSDADYAIHYLDSRNMMYKNGKIHRNYNRWIHKLSTDIDKNLH